MLLRPWFHPPRLCSGRPNTAQAKALGRMHDSFLNTSSSELCKAAFQGNELVDGEELGPDLNIKSAKCGYGLVILY